MGLTLTEKIIRDHLVVLWENAYQDYLGLKVEAYS